jgi:hypothetical protein
VILARSGAFGDEIRIVTLDAAAGFAGIGRTLVTTSTLDPHILIPFIGALILAVLLLLGAVVLQWRLHHRAVAVPGAAHAPAPAVAVEAPAPPPAPRPRAPRRPRAAKAAEPATPPPATEPESLAKAVGAEDTAVDSIAPVIPLRPPDEAGVVQARQAARRAPAAEGQITRTRARAKTDKP